MSENNNQNPLRHFSPVADEPAAPPFQPGAQPPRQYPAEGFALKVIALIVAGFAAQLAASFLIPVVLGALLYFLLSPMVERLKRASVPRLVGAILALTLLYGPLVLGIFTLAEPAEEWLREAPTSMSELKTEFDELVGPIERMREASDAVERAVKDITENDEPGTTVVKLSEPGLLETAAGYVPEIAGALLLSFALAFLLLLANGRPIYRALAFSGRFGSQRRAIWAMRRIRRDVSRYLGTVFFINVCLGGLSAFAFWLLDVPNPVLWGAVGGLLNFAPYVGPAITTGIMVVVGVSSFDGVTLALAPAAAFALLTVTEGALITPIVVGHRLQLGPTWTLLAVIGMGWLWGLPGALLAIPLTRTLMILYETFVVHRAARTPGSAQAQPQIERSA